jgi:hypothetical protein
MYENVDEWDRVSVWLIDGTNGWWIKDSGCVYGFLARVA